MAAGPSGVVLCTLPLTTTLATVFNQSMVIWYVLIFSYTHRNLDNVGIAILQAARRRAITELLFFASVGDLRRCQRIVRIWKLDVKDKSCCDYDRRTPMYVPVVSLFHVYLGSQPTRCDMQAFSGE